MTEINAVDLIRQFRQEMGLSELTAEETQEIEREIELEEQKLKSLSLNGTLDTADLFGDLR